MKCVYQSVSVCQSQEQLLQKIIADTIRQISELWQLSHWESYWKQLVIWVQSLFLAVGKEFPSKLEQLKKKYNTLHPMS